MVICTLSHQSIIKILPHRLALRPVLGTHFLSEILFPDMSGLYPVDKINQHIWVAEKVLTFH